MTVELGRARWRARLVTSILVCGLAAGTTVAVSQAALATGCRPGSGRQLAGHHFTSGEISSLSGGMRCANLTGADLSGLSLVQVDFTGALLRNANLQHADLTQATLDRAILSGANLTNATLDQASALGTNFSGANLSGASMIQVTAHSANFTNANLSGVDLSQADLTGSTLSHAKIGGASFSQATLTGTNFKGVTGLAPWSTYLLIGCCVIFLLLVWGTIRRRMRGASMRRRPDFAISSTGRAQVSVVRGLIGAVVVALGFHLFVGGLGGTILGALGPPITQTCTAGPLCTVGVASGFIGIFVGIFVIIVGFALRAGGSKSSRTAYASGATGATFGLGGTFGPSGNFGPGQGGSFNPGGNFGQGGSFNPGGNFGQGGSFNPGGNFGQGGMFTPGGTGAATDFGGPQDSGPTDSGTPPTW